LKPGTRCKGEKKHEIAKSENEQSEHAKHHFSVARRRRKRPERPTLAEIRHRAFEIHIEHGGIHGCDLDDWLQAERELQEKYNKINDGRQKKK
jgi:hypothetical protein